MKLGEIYVWDTDKAVGHDSRKKYHVFICPADWREGHTFLFISKADYGGDFAISNDDYKFLPIPVSYVSCTSIVCYTDQELADCKSQLVGQLLVEHMKALFNAVQGSEIMEQRNILRVCNALRAAF
jgi:hypothetical protein